MQEPTDQTPKTLRWSCDTFVSRLRLLVLLLVLCVTRHLAPNPTARATHAWNQACNTKWLVRLLGPRVGRRDAEDKTNKTRRFYKRYFFIYTFLVKLGFLFLTFNSQLHNSELLINGFVHSISLLTSILRVHFNSTAGMYTMQRP